MSGHHKWADLKAARQKDFPSYEDWIRLYGDDGVPYPYKSMIPPKPPEPEPKPPVIPDRIIRFQRYNEFAQGFLDGSLSFDDGYSAEDIRANVTAIVNLLAVAAQGEVDNLRKALRECIHGWDGHEWMDPNYDEWDRLAAPEMP